MAEEATVTKQDTSQRLSNSEAIQKTRAQLEEMIGRPVETVLGLRRGPEGWVITVQVVELQRIPASTDVLGSYEVEVDADASVVSYRRIKRYYRNRPDEG